MMLTIGFVVAVFFPPATFQPSLSLSAFWHQIKSSCPAFCFSSTYCILAPIKQLMCWLLFLFNILHYACNFYMIQIYVHIL